MQKLENQIAEQRKLEEVLAIKTEILEEPKDLPAEPVPPSLEALRDPSLD